jgi:hypothetical protein
METPMEPSPELQELTRRIAQAVGDGDVAFFDRHVSRQANVAFLGTDPDEWWTDLAGLGQALAAQREAGVEVAPGDPLANAEGDAGWAVDRKARYRIGDQEISFRFSVGYGRQDGDWKIAHPLLQFGWSIERRGARG